MTFLGREMECPIMNASGPLCTWEHELKILDECPYTCAVVTKSCTAEPRDGNEHPRYWQNENLTINSTGLANPGPEYYRKLRGFTKPYILSVAGLTQEDNINIISDVAFSSESRYIDAIELNLSCPNIKGKPQTGYDLDATRILLSKLENYGCFERIDPLINRQGRIDIGLKLPPYLDKTQLENMADFLSSFSLSFVTCINSLGNGLILGDDYEPVIAPVYGGLGGNEIVKAIGLSNCKQFRDILPSRIDVIGCGGIRTGRDVKEYLSVGCVCVQIGSTFMKEGVSCFERIAKELKELKND